MRDVKEWGLGEEPDVRRAYAKFTPAIAFLAIIGLLLADLLVSFPHFHPIALALLAPAFLLSMKGIDDGAGPFVVFGIIYSFGLGWTLHLIVTRWLVDPGRWTLAEAIGATVGYATGASLLVAVFAYVCYTIFPITRPSYKITIEFRENVPSFSIISGLNGQQFHVLGGGFHPASGSSRDDHLKTE